MGVFFRNSNAMSPVITYMGEKESTLSYISTGGQIEIVLFFKGGPKEIIKAYQNFIGKPTLTPFWSLGWHASAYAYQTQTDVQENIDGYKTAGIPLEGIWLDIPYLDAYADFSVNATAFPDIKGLTDTCHSNNQRVIPIIDAGISADDLSNKYILQANQDELLIKSSINKNDTEFIVNHVWPNKTAFLDFFNPKSKDIWAMGFNDLYKLFEYDGIWLDMNEATGFCNGECPSGKVPNHTDPTPDQNYGWWTSYDTQEEISTYKLPFIPGGKYNLDNMTLSLNATHPYNGLKEYDVHSLFGHVEGMRTFEIFTNDSTSPLQDKRTFFLSRSTFAGSGQYLQHWLGDNHRTWEDMKASIAGVMNMNMFGFPMVGPDTCGFFQPNTTDNFEEICGRWIQLATFYPFARQHRDISGGGQPNEPWNLPEPY